MLAKPPFGGNGDLVGQISMTDEGRDMGQTSEFLQDVAFRFYAEILRSPCVLQPHKFTRGTVKRNVAPCATTCHTWGTEDRLADQERPHPISIRNLEPVSRPCLDESFAEHLANVGPHGVVGGNSVFAENAFLVVEVVVVVKRGFIHTVILYRPRQDPLSSHVEAELSTGELRETPEDVTEVSPLRDVVDRPRDDSSCTIPAHEAVFAANDEDHEEENALLDGEDELGVGDGLATDLDSRLRGGWNDAVVRVDERVLVSLVGLEFQSRKLISPVRTSICGNAILGEERSVDSLPGGVDG